MNSSAELSTVLLDMIVCPIDNQTLAYVPSENVLYNPRLRKSYEIKDGIPVMLQDETSDVSDEDHQRYIDNTTRHTGPRATHLL